MLFDINLNNRLLRYFYYRILQKKQMLANSPYYLCQQFKHSLKANSPLYHVKSTPKNIYLTSNKSFFFCDIQKNKTLIKQFQIQSKASTQSGYHSHYQQNHPNQNESKQFDFSNPNYEDLNKITVIDEIDGIFTTHAFTDDSILLLNRAGDFYYYNLLNKNIFTAQKQHPGLYSDAQILTLEGYFVTCGGCVKNTLTGQSQHIIKLWKINEDEDVLQVQARINTGHLRSIQNSFLLNNKVVTMSCDKTLRISNLFTECIQRVISVNQDLFAGCNIDYNTIIVGGLGKHLRIYDARTSRSIMFPITIPRELIQVTKIIRFNQNNLLLSNVNQLFTLDLRLMKLQEQSKYEGERISELTVINRAQIFIGNREKTFQVWKAE